MFLYHWLFVKERRKVLYTHDNDDYNYINNNSADKKHICKNKGENRQTLLFRYERFINFLTSVHRHEERDTILKSLS